MKLEETEWNNEFTVKEILISWDINDEPVYDESIAFNIDSDDEED